MAPSPASSSSTYAPNGGVSTSRPRSTSTTSTAPSLSSPLARRTTRPTAFSPLGSYSSTSPAATPSSSSNYHHLPNTPTNSTSRYPSSIHSHIHLSGASATGNSYAHSTAGSQATLATTVPGGVTRFKRAQHARGKNAPVGVRSGNPDEVDLSTLEDPDDLFRLFSVRDVRGLEKRASDAAAAKVAELRIMVGERYRDLLSAADSIVRMRHAADKLVDHLDRIDSVVASVTEADSDTFSSPLTNRRGTLTSRTPSSIPGTPTRSSALPTTPAQQQEPLRTLSSPPSLSLTIHLLLSLPSLVHALVESGHFLHAARLEGVAKLVYEELSTYREEGEDVDDDMEGGGGLLEDFPIIERQWESVASLSGTVVRRAKEELRVWDSSPLDMAKTLSSISLLERLSLSDSLSLLLSARTDSLTSILSSPPHKSRSGKPHHEIESVVANLQELLGLVLKTVECAEGIFVDGLLGELLREVERPSEKVEVAGGGGTDGASGGKTAAVAASTIDSLNTTSSTTSPTQLVPTLSTLPNYPLLSRHLPPSILSFTPDLSFTSTAQPLSPNSAAEQISAWSETATARVVAGVTEWISTLHGGAKTLSSVRAAVRASLQGDSPTATRLRTDLEDAVETRLSEVYAAHLSLLIDRVEPCLSSLLESLPSSKADSDPALFVFESPLAFPPASHYALPNRAAGNDPFEGFLDKIEKRVTGRGPLLDRGLGEVEGHARELREDLEGWLGGSEQDGGETRARLRKQYVISARKTFEGVYNALSTVLERVKDDVASSLFLGNFAFALSLSKTFARDLLLGSAHTVNDHDDAIVAEWNSKLASLQAKSLIAWRTSTVRAAVVEIETSTKNLPSSSPTSPSGPFTIPSQPSPSVLAALRILASAVRHVGPHRTQADPTITENLLDEFRAASLDVSKELLATARGLEREQRGQVAVQAAWDTRFLARFWPAPDSGWDAVQRDLVSLAGGVSASDIDSATLHYLQRTQTIFAPLLSSPPPSLLPLPGATPSKLLPWGLPPSGLDSKSVPALVQGARLGLLPTR